MKKQQKRKEKEKAKQRKRAAPEKVSVAPSTLGGRVGEMVDRYRKMTMKEYNDVVELCHMHGVQLSKGVLGRGRFVFKGRHILIPMTSPWNKSRGQVLSCELAIVASQSSCRDQLWSLRLIPRIQTSFNF